MTTPDSSLALAGLRVIDFGSFVSAPYAAKQFADLGADVIKVEPPGGEIARTRGPFPPGREGDPEASGLFLYLNANKRGVELDLRGAEDRLAFDALLATADVLIHNTPIAEAERLGLDAGDLAKRFPQLVHTWIAPFGLSGPHARFRGTDLNTVAGGGWASITPGIAPSTDQPPLKAFGVQGDFQAGSHAALVTMAGLFARRLSGRGQLIEVSEQECIAAQLEMAFVFYTHNDLVPSRAGSRSHGPSGIMPCKDGLIFVMTLDEHQWRAMVHMMGDPEWGSWPIFEDRLKRGENADVLGPLIAEWLIERTVEEVFDLAGEYRLPFAPVSTMKDVVNSPHLKERGFFEQQAQPHVGDITVPGAPVILSETPWSLRLPAPALGQHTDEVRAELSVGVGPRVDAPDRGPGPVPNTGATAGPMPLQGIRIIDMTWMWAGPYATLQLAHLGAEVIRLETHQRPCANRRVPPFADFQQGLNRGGSFNEKNQGKVSFLLDMKKPEAVELAKELVATADVFVENYAVGVLDRLGLGWSDLHAVNPRLVMASLSGYGQTGPYRHRVAFGAPLTMISGLAALTGFPDDGPTQVGISYADPNAGLHAAFAVLAALEKREETGRGQYIDCSEWESLLAILPEGLLPFTMRGEQLPRMGNRDILMAPHGVYRASGEDRWVSIVVQDDAEWERFAAIVGGGLTSDARFRTAAGRKQNEDDLEALVTAWTSQRDRWEVTRVLQAAGIAAFPAFDVQDVDEDPHMNGRGFFTELPHPEVGVRKHVGIPWKFHGTPISVRHAAPCMGDANEYVVKKLLGRSQEEYERLEREGVLY